MNHYPHHIGDFDKATRHLTRLERSVYRDLLDMYYDTEAMIPLDQDVVCRKILARSNEEATAVEQTLNEFFTQTPTGWYHDRCEVEIAAYHSNTTQKALAGKASAKAKAEKRAKTLEKLNTRSTAVEQPLIAVATPAQQNSTNQNQNQNQNQEDKAPAAAPPFVLPDWIPLASWTGYTEMRKKQRKPMTERARTLVIAELLKNKQLGHDVAQMLDKSTANCWTDVYTPKDNTVTTFAQQKADVARTTVPQNPEVQATLQRLQADAALPRSGPSLQVLEQMAKLRAKAAA